MRSDVTHSRRCSHRLQTGLLIRSATSLARIAVLLLCVAACNANRETHDVAIPDSGNRLEGARVEHVKDGDSLVVIHDGVKIEVRLFGIDAPEKNQPYANEARQAARDLMDNRTIDLVIRDRDRYQRLVADVYVDNDPVSVNQQLVARGAAWAYTRYSNNPALLQAEELARERRVGLWALPESDRVAPWEWRKNN